MPQVEAAAYKEIVRYERRFGPIKTPFTPSEKFVDMLWGYKLLYDDPRTLGFPPDARGGLRADIRTVLVATGLTRGQENATMLHEGGHLVLHIPDALQGGAAQRELFRMGGEQPVAYYCRGRGCYRNNRAEQPYEYREAEYFAACMLLPRDRFLPVAKDYQARLSDVGSQDTPWAIEFLVGMLADHYQEHVSKALIRIRLAELGLISQESATALGQAAARRGAA